MKIVYKKIPIYSKIKAKNITTKNLDFIMRILLSLKQNRQYFLLKKFPVLSDNPVFYIDFKDYDNFFFQLVI